MIVFHRYVVPVKYERWVEGGNARATGVELGRVLYPATALRKGAAANAGPRLLYYFAGISDLDEDARI